MGNISKQWIAALSSRLWTGMVMAFLLGQTLGMYEVGYLEPSLSVLMFIYLLSFTSSIIFLNHYMDIKSDAMKVDMNANALRYRFFPSKNALRNAGVSLGLFSMLILGGLSYFHHHYMVSGLGIIGWVLFLMYSFSPIRMNYRGGGELLELLGLAVLLPIFSISIYHQELFTNDLFSLILPFSLLIMGNSVAHSLTHIKSDRYSGKTTLATVSGFKTSRIFIESVLLGYPILLILLKITMQLPVNWIFVAISGVASLYFFNQIKQISPSISLDEKNTFNLFEFHMNSAVLFCMGVLDFGIFYEYLIRP